MRWAIPRRRRLERRIVRHAKGEDERNAKSSEFNQSSERVRSVCLVFKQYPTMRVCGLLGCGVSRSCRSCQGAASRRSRAGKRGALQLMAVAREGLSGCRKEQGDGAREEAATTLGVVEGCRRRDCTRSTRPSWVLWYKEACVAVESRCDDAARGVYGMGSR